jgi:hypothetical protein
MIGNSFQDIEAAEMEKVAQFLFGLLDDIDTVSDIAKGDNALYREIVERIQRKRFEVGSTDGYTVTFSPVETSGGAE